MEDGEICIVNIGPKQRRRRAIFGTIMGVVTLGLGVILVTGDSSRWLRLLLALPAGMAASGVLQAYEKT